MLKDSHNEIIFAHPVKHGFLSVIVPVYKDPDGLKKTLDGLAAQTIPHKDYEVLVANDGADPEITRLCQEYENVRELSIHPNKGSYNARDTALAESRGEYIAFTDADVILPPTWLAEGRKLLSQYDYVGGPVRFPKLARETAVTLYEKNTGFATERYFTIARFCITANLFTTREVIETVGGFDRRMYSGGDYEFGDRVYRSGKFKQGYSENISIEHPHRTYKEILKKLKRTTQGFNHLVSLYPDRFNSKFYLLDGFLFAIKPPKLTGGVGLFVFTWWMRFVDLYYKAKYYKFAKLTGFGDSKN